MRKSLTFLVVLAILACTAGSAMGAVATGVSVPVYSEQKSGIRVTGNPQFEYVFLGISTWQWSTAMSEYPKGLPTGIGATLRVYPNVMADVQGIKGVFVAFSELADTIELPSPLVLQCQKDIRGRWFVDIPIDQYPGPQFLRFYAWIQDGKRKDHDFLIIFHWATKKDSSQMAETFEYTTSPWCGAVPTKATYVALAMSQAKVGGSGLVYDQMVLVASGGRTTSGKKEEAPVKFTLNVTGIDYFGAADVRFRDKSGKWVKVESDIKTPTRETSLPAGHYEMAVIVASGASRWIPFEVATGMDPVSVNIN